MRVSLTRTSKIPPVPGIKATSPSSVSNVVKSSCAIQAARNSHRHWMQYWIATRGRVFIVHCTPLIELIAHVPRSSRPAALAHECDNSPRCVLATFLSETVSEGLYRGSGDMLTT